MQRHEALKPGLCPLESVMQTAHGIDFFAAPTTLWRLQRSAQTMQVELKLSSSHDASQKGQSPEWSRESLRLAQHRGGSSLRGILSTFAQAVQFQLSMVNHNQEMLKLL